MIYDYLIFMFGTGIGAVIRFSLTNFWKKSNKGQLATFTVNMFSSFIAGVLFNFSPSLQMIILGFGLIGGMSTYSTFNGEIANSFFGLKFRNAFIYPLLSYGLGITLCYIGYLLPQYV